MVRRRVWRRFGKTKEQQKLLPQRSQDSAAVKRAVLDYVEGFYEGDTAKIARAFRPDVYKYGFDLDEKAHQYVGELMKYDEIVAYARRFKERGRKTPPTAPKVVDLLDVQEQIASAKLTAWWGVDYVLLAKYDGRWMISSIMWQGMPLKPCHCRRPFFTALTNGTA